jgi:hypothetical protein
MIALINYEVIQRHYLKCRRPSALNHARTWLVKRQEFESGRWRPIPWGLCLDETTTSSRNVGHQWPSAAKPYPKRTGTKAQ